MTYSISEVWVKGEDESTVIWFTKHMFATSEAGLALQKMGYTLKGREVFPERSKDEVVAEAFEGMKQRQEAISGRS